MGYMSGGLLFQIMTIFLLVDQACTCVDGGKTTTPGCCTEAVSAYTIGFASFEMIVDYFEASDWLIRLFTLLVDQ